MAAINMQARPSLPKKKSNGLEWDDWDNAIMDDDAILKDSLVKVKTTKEYSFGTVKLIHHQDENTGKESFRIIARSDELSSDEAKILANVIKDIYAEEDEDNGGDQTRKGNGND